MDYGEVLSKAWRIIWKHKVLWIFGILASCSQTAGGSGSNSGFRFQGNQPFQGQFQNQFPQLQEAINRIPAWVWILLVLLILGLVVLAIFLSTIGRIGLIRGVNLADEGAGRLSFGELFSGSLPYFWRLFFLNLLVGLALLVVILVLIAIGTAFAVVTLGIGALCLIPLICLLIPISWLISVVVEQANIAVVTENLGIIAGLQRAWEVVTKNLGPYIIMALILIIGGGIISIVIALPLIAIAVPAIIAAASGGEQALTGGFLVSAVLFIIYLPILIVLGGILQTYIFSTWTLTFRRLIGRGGLVPTPAPAAPGF